MGCRQSVVRVATAWRSLIAFSPARLCRGRDQSRHKTTTRSNVLTIFVPNSIFVIIDFLALCAIIIHKFGTHILVGDALPPRTGSPAPVDRRQWPPARFQEVSSTPRQSVAQATGSWP